MSDSPRYRLVLAATDFSPAAERAVAWAVELAAQRRAELRLVHALVPPGATELAPHLGWTLTEELLAVARQRLAELALPLRQRVPEVTLEVELGSAAEVVLAAARAHRPELLVVGTRGLRGWRHVLLGSTAARVLAHASCPVLAVHETDAGLPHGGMKLLVATDFSDDADRALDAAVRLLPEAIAEVVLLHAFAAPLPAATPEAYLDGELVDKLRRSAEEGLAEAAAKLHVAGLHVHTELRDGYPPEVIAQTASDLGADLVVMGTRGRGGIAHLLLGSNAERAIQHVHCPLLVLPRRAWQEQEGAGEEAVPLVGAALDEQC